MRNISETAATLSRPDSRESKFTTSSLQSPNLWRWFHDYVLCNEHRNINDGNVGIVCRTTQLMHLIPSVNATKKWAKKTFSLHLSWACKATLVDHWYQLPENKCDHSCIIPMWRSTVIPMRWCVLIQKWFLKQASTQHPICNILMLLLT